MCKAFRNYFSSTFRKDEGNDPKLNYSAISRMQQFTISAEHMHQQLIKVQTKYTQEFSPVLQAIWLRLWQSFSTTRSRLALFRRSGNRQLFVQSIRRVASTMFQTTGYRGQANRPVVCNIVLATFLIDWTNNWRFPLRRNNAGLERVVKKLCQRRSQIACETGENSWVDFVCTFALPWVQVN